MSKRCLVIRVGNFDGYDPVVEINRIILKEGHCWFGKYGRPISAKAFSKNTAERLFIVNRKGKTYSLHQFKILAAKRTVPKDRVYPEYYNDVISKISTWIKIINIEPINVVIDDLILMDTRSRLSDALRRSMSAHFICENIEVSR